MRKEIYPGTYLVFQNFDYVVEGKMNSTLISSFYQAKKQDRNQSQIQYVIIKRTQIKFDEGKEEMSKIIKDYALKEIKILQEIKNPNIVGYIDHHETSQSVFLVLEYCDCGDLGKLLATTRLQESEAIGIFKQIMNGLQGLHKYGVIHKNLKPSNILVHDFGKIIKISGLRNCILEDEQTNNNILSSQGIEQIGHTHCDQAPEVILEHQYGLKADVFSMGLIFYQLLTKKSPFPITTQDEYIKAIRYQSTYHLGNIPWPLKISSGCKDLIEKMLKFDPKERITFEEIYKHPSLQNVLLKTGVNPQLLSTIHIKNENQIQDEIKNEEFYRLNSTKIDQQLIQGHSQLHQTQIKKILFPQIEYLDSLRDLCQQYEIKNNPSQIQLQQEQQLKSICNQLNIIYYFNNTIEEIATLQISDKYTKKIQCILTLKGFKEIQRLYDLLRKLNTEQNNQNRNQFEILAKILKELLEIMELQIDQNYKSQSKLFSIETLDKQLFENGKSYINHYTEHIRYHRHLFECIKNRHLQDAKFEPNLALEFDLQDIEKKEEKLHEIMNSLQQ